MIRALATPQQGVVARSQLRAVGLPPHAIDQRVRDGRLLGLYRGVYRVVGPVAGAREAEMGAVLACGDGALLSHRSAAALWSLTSPRSGEALDVSVEGTLRRPGPAVRVHRLSGLDRRDRTVLDGIPITTPARTLLDLAAAAARREVEQAMAAGERRQVISRHDVEAVLGRYPRSPGAAMLGALVAAGAEPAFTRSVAEEKLLALVRCAKLPRPRLNLVVCGYEVDFLWPAERLVVEVDGLAYHSSTAARRRDRRRDGDLVAAGYTVLRVTWADLHHDRDPLLARLAGLLARLAGSPPAGR